MIVAVTTANAKAAFTRDVRAEVTVSGAVFDVASAWNCERGARLDAATFNICLDKGGAVLAVEGQILGLARRSLRGNVVALYRDVVVVEKEVVEE